MVTLFHAWALYHLYIVDVWTLLKWRWTGRKLTLRKEFLRLDGFLRHRLQQLTVACKDGLQRLDEWLQMDGRTARTRATPH